MSLTVKHLNADTTFYLTFSPTNLYPESPGPHPGSFSILLDPWLSGPSDYIHPRFSTVKHTIPACISSLEALPEPDLVVISCAKPDHCHEDTLRQLPSHGTDTRILANSQAAKIVRSWKHFDPQKIEALQKYDERNDEKTVRRFLIPAPTPAGSPGQVTVAYIPGRYDLAGVHSAIGITYRPPTFAPYFEGVGPSSSPPASPDSVGTWKTSYSHPGDKTISVIYSPHGVPFAQLRPYASAHLVTEAALPLTALLHSFDRVENPWWLGGNVSAGLPGGLEIAKNLLARYWISAHDEEKEVGGVTAKPLRYEKWNRKQVESLVEEVIGRMGAKVLELGVGEEMIIYTL
jgi:hypothetical protein